VLPGGDGAMKRKETPTQTAERVVKEKFEKYLKDEEQKRALFQYICLWLELKTSGVNDAVKTKKITNISPLAISNTIMDGLCTLGIDAAKNCLKFYNTKFPFNYNPSTEYEDEDKDLNDVISNLKTKEDDHRKNLILLFYYNILDSDRQKDVVNALKNSSILQVTELIQHENNEVVELNSNSDVLLRIGRLSVDDYFSFIFKFIKVFNEPSSHEILKKKECLFKSCDTWLDKYLELAKETLENHQESEEQATPEEKTEIVSSPSPTPTTSSSSEKGKEKVKITSPLTSSSFLSSTPSGNSNADQSETQLQHALDENSRLRAQIEELRRESAEVSNQHQNELAGLYRRIQGVDEARNAELANLRKELKAAQDKLAARSLTSEKTANEIIELRNQLEQSQQRENEMKEVLNKLSEELRERNEALRSSSESNTLNNQSVESLTSQLEESNSQLAESQKEVEALNKTIDNLRLEFYQQQALTNSQLAESQKEINALNEIVGYLQQELNQQREQLNARKSISLDETQKIRVRDLLRGVKNNVDKLRGLSLQID